MTLLFQIFIVSAVLALAVVNNNNNNNIVFRAAVDIDPDVLHDADKLGPGTSYLAQFLVAILKFLKKISPTVKIFHLVLVDKAIALLLFWIFV